jgi:hypothetical protein
LNRDVNLAFIPPNPILPLSSVVDITGMEGDTFVLQMSYDEAMISSLLGSESNARLGWLDNGVWGLAVSGNNGGSPQFILGAWNSGYGLGTYGVDTSANTVWGVINHNSSFGLWGLNSVPEPNTFGLLLVGFGTMLFRVNRRKRT